MSILRARFADFVPSLVCIILIGLATVLFGADTPIASLLISFLILISTAVFVWRNQDIYPKPIILLMFILWAALWALHTQLGYTTGHGDEYLMILAGIAVFWLGQHEASESLKPHKIWNLILVLGLIFSIFSFFQYLQSPDRIFGWDRPYHQGRLGGTFLSSNTAATFLGMISIAASAHIYRSWKIANSKFKSGKSSLTTEFIQKSALGITTFLFAFTCLILTASRSGIALTVIALIVFLIWVAFDGRSKKSQDKRFFLGPEILWSLAGMVVIFIIWNVSGDMAGGRYSRLFSDFQARQDIVTASWIGFKYEPIWGHGLGHLNEAKLLGADPISNSNVMRQNASHNFYIQTLVQTGIAGLIAAFIAYAVIIVSVARGIINKVPYSTYLMAVIVISIFVCAHGLFDYALEIPAVMLFHAWLLGIGYGIQQKYR